MKYDNYRPCKHWGEAGLGAILREAGVHLVSCARFGGLVLGSQKQDDPFVLSEKTGNLIGTDWKVLEGICT